MKIDMRKFKTHRFVPASAPILSVLLALGLIGCDGGLNGEDSSQASSTSELNSADSGQGGADSGQGGSGYELQYLPNRISPDMPKALLKGEDATALGIVDNNTEHMSGSPRNQDDEMPKSWVWQDLSEELFRVSFIRFGIESNATIVDLAFDDILIECAEQLLDCTIPADQIRITITREVVDRLTKLHTEWAETNSLPWDTFWFMEEGFEVDELHQVNYEFLLDKEVVLGETHYSQLDGAPYDHTIRTYIKRGSDQGDDLLLGPSHYETFSAHWHEDGQVAKFKIGATEQTMQEYFYQNNAPGELVTSNIVDKFDDGTFNEFYTKILGNEPAQSGILVEAAFTHFVHASSNFSSVDADGNLVESDTNSTVDSHWLERAYNLIQTQMDDRGGYSTKDSRWFVFPQQHFLTTSEGYRESYNQIGELLASERCSGGINFSDLDNCEEGEYEFSGPAGSSITDSVHYFTPEAFDLLVANQNAIRWKVEGVPKEIKDIGVISAQSQSDLSNSEAVV